jgi:hypothetical protein
MRPSGRDPEPALGISQASRSTSGRLAGTPHLHGPAATATVAAAHSGDKSLALGDEQERCVGGLQLSSVGRAPQRLSAGRREHVAGSRASPSPTATSVAPFVKVVQGACTQTRSLGAPQAATTRIVIGGVAAADRTTGRVRRCAPLPAAALAIIVIIIIIISWRRRGVVRGSPRPRGCGRASGRLAVGLANFALSASDDGEAAAHTQQTSSLAAAAAAASNNNNDDDNDGDDE